MTRIEWLLKGDPLFSLQVARRTEPSMTIEDDEVKFIPVVIESIPEPVRVYIGPGGPGSKYWYKGQRSVMP